MPPNNCYPVGNFVVPCTIPNFNAPGDLKGCGSVVLPNISGSGLSGGEAYYTQPDGGGNEISTSTTIFQSTTLYIYDNTIPCSDDEEEVEINIINGPVIEGPVELTGCGTIILPAIEGQKFDGQ